MSFDGTTVRDKTYEGTEEGGREAVKQFIDSQRGNHKFQWLADAEGLAEPLKIHLSVR
jgi:hypothetical protein